MPELWASSSHLQKYDEGVDTYIRQPSTSISLCRPEQRTETLTERDSASSFIQQLKTAACQRSEGWPRVDPLLLRSPTCHICPATHLLNATGSHNHVVTAFNAELCAYVLYVSIRPCRTQTLRWAWVSNHSPKPASPTRRTIIAFGFLDQL